MALSVGVVSAIYLVVAFVKPAYKRIVSRRNYDPIDGDATANEHATLGRNKPSAAGSGGRVAVSVEHSAVQTGGGLPIAGGALGRSVIVDDRESSQYVDGVLGRGWRAYGTTEEASASSGCLLPTTTSR